MVLDGAGAADATPAAAAGAGAASSSIDTSTMTVEQLQEVVKQLQDQIMKQRPVGYRVARSLTSSLKLPCRSTLPQRRRLRTLRVPRRRLTATAMRPWVAVAAWARARPRQHQS
jgi:hypothetical protein